MGYFILHFVVSAIYNDNILVVLNKQGLLEGDKYEISVQLQANRYITHNINIIVSELIRTKQISIFLLVLLQAV